MDNILLEIYILAKKLIEEGEVYYTCIAVEEAAIKCGYLRYNPEGEEDIENYFDLTDIIREPLMIHCEYNTWNSDSTGYSCGPASIAWFSGPASKKQRLMLLDCIIDQLSR